MNIRQRREQNAMLARLFVRLLPVQVAIVAMGSINSIVDGVVAARFINPATVGVVGLYFTMIRILEAAGSVLLGGVTVLSGRCLGSGKVDETRGITSLGLALALIIGAFLTIASFAAPGVIADLLGANEQLHGPLSVYVRGYAVGIIPQLAGQQFASMLQLERKEKRGHAAIAAMIICNVLLDILFVIVLKMDVLGLVLATSIANWAYFLVVASYYLTKHAQLKPSMKLVAWCKSFSVIKIGFSGALLVICLAARTLVLNRLLLSSSGSDALSAMSAFNMISGLILAIPIGSGALIRMLSSVFLGEDNREGLVSLIQILETCVLALMTAVAILVIILSPFLAKVFFADTASEVYILTKQLFIIYGIGLPITLVCIIFSSYYQAAGHLLFVNFISVMDGFLSSVIPAFILAPRMGALGVWLALLIGLILTLAASILYPILRLKRLPRRLDEWMLLPPEFGSGERLILNLHSMEDVTQTALQVQTFCDAHSLPHRTGFQTGLCLEEMAGNIIRYGFGANHKKHDIEVRVVIKEGDAVLRIKDDCRPFNPKEWHEMTTPAEDPSANVGIRLVYGIARQIEYQNLLGLNVLTVIVSKA